MTAQQTDATTDPQSIIAALRAERDAALAREAALAEALTTRNSEYGERIEQQSATIDVLKVMSVSPGDPLPVFDLIANRARAFCEADGAMVALLEDGMMHLRTHIGATQAASAAYEAYFPCPVDDSTTLGRAALTRAPVHNPNLLADPGYRMKAITSVNLVRSNAAVPILRGGVPIGAIGINWFSVGEFPTAQLELLKTFAEQAVIAITSAETYRALQTRTADLQESLEYQTATSDVLKVISRSTFDLQPVLDMLAKTAAKLCAADQAAIARRDGDKYALVTNFGFPPEYEARQREIGPRLFNPDSPAVGPRAIAERCVVHVHDVAAVPGYPDHSVSLGKQRTSLGVPLLREGEPIGMIVLARQRVEPFTDRQIELVSTFADQAVIAIENTRLITEQREALEQQTATAEVLQVINASPGNLAPVFEAILEKAHALCGAAIGTLMLYDGAVFRAVATRGYPEHYSALVREPFPPGIGHQALIRGDRLFHVSDMQAVASVPGVEARLRFFIELGLRTGLFVPLRKDGVLLGIISAARLEVRSFSDKEIALLENFAAQAVIAMDNARLLTEQREALEQQTATAEVLGVINRCPGDLSPVFEAILEKAIRLCDSAVGTFTTYDGHNMRCVATRGLTPAQEALLADRPPAVDQPTGRIADGEDVVHLLDARDQDGYRAGFGPTRIFVDQVGARTAMWVALRKDKELLGILTIFRRQVRAFTDKEIALVQNFAAQAVIAMENARLINETREALEQQTATAEVLGVINSSPGDLGPVFDAILEKAHALCGAATGSLQLYDGEFVRVVATRGLPDEFVNMIRQPRRSDLNDAFLRGAPFVQITDIADPALTGADETLMAAHDIAGVRTLLRVPLRKDDVLLGWITAGRREVRAFSHQEISLLQSFAAQAVIAIENARLLGEIRQRQSELQVTFDNMADGVAMFDGNLRLAAWNRNFQELVDIPAAVLAECPSYAEYLRILAERGEFGTEDIEAELSRRLEHADQELRLERTRPHGQVIEVRRNAVPDGGFVLIYSDITERKRSEAEIRAARDAAEAAYRELKAAQANLIQAEKMASLGQLTAGIAHEIKNPLNFVNNFAALSVDLLAELKESAAPCFAALTNDQRAEVEGVSAMLTSNLEKITEHGKRADGIVKAMLEHSRGSSAERRVVDLNALIDEALNLAYHGARAQDQSFAITLERDFGEGIAPIEVNPQDMTRVFLNIFSNGFYATTRRARSGADAAFVPVLKVTTRDKGEALEIRVRDNGIGIPADIRDKLFQPFFTTKPTGEGTGLGLSITYDIVTKQHGGMITVESEVGEYSEFTVRLPRFASGGSRA